MMPTGDFWFLAGIAVLCLGIGQCQRMQDERWINTPEKAAAEMMKACATRIEMGYDVPAVCKPDEALAVAKRGELETK